MKLVIGSWFALAGPLFAAGLSFSEPLKEIHAEVDVEAVSMDFEFKNETEKDVFIQKTDAGCSCIAVQISGGKRKYAPGESGVIRVNFDVANLSGRVDKHVQVWLEGDEPNKPSSHLTLRVHIPVVVSLEPKTLKWEAGSEPATQKIEIVMDDKNPIHISEVNISTDAFSHELKTLEEGKRYELMVTPKSTDAAGTLGIIRILTDAASEKHRLQQAFAVVQRKR